MAELSLKEKKEYAYLLFTKQGLTQKEIAAKVGATEKTIGVWKTEGNWERLRASIMTTREEQLSMLYDQLNDINMDIRLREKGKRYSNSKEADTIMKLSATIKNLQIETGIAEIVSVGKELCDLVRTADLKKAQDIAEWNDAMVKTKLKK